MTPRRDTFARLGVEPLEVRTLLHANPLDFDANAFAQLDDPSRNATAAEYRTLTDHTQKVVDDTSASLDAIFGNIGSLNAIVDGTQAKAAALQGNVDMLGANGIATETSIAVLRQKQTVLTQDIVDIDSATHRLTVQLTAENTMLGHLQQAELSLQKKLEALGTERSGLEATDEETMQTMTSLKEMLATTHREIAAEAQRLAVLQEALAATQTEIKTLAETLVTIETRLTDLAGQTSTVTAQKSFFEAERARLGGEIEKQTVMLTTATSAQTIAQSAYNTALTQLDAATKNITTQTAVVQTLTQQLTTQQATYATLKLQYDAALKLRPRNITLERSLKTSMGTVATQINTTKTQISTATTMLTQYRNAEAAAKTAVATAKTTLDGKTAIVTTESATLSGLQSQHATAVQGITASTTQLELLASHTTDAQAQRTSTLSAREAAEANTLSLEAQKTHATRALSVLNNRSAEASAAVQTAEQTHENTQQALQANMQGVLEIGIELRSVQEESGTRASAAAGLQTSLRDLSALRTEKAGALTAVVQEIDTKIAVQEAVFSSLAFTRSALDAALDALATHIAQRDLEQANAVTASRDLAVALQEDRVADETLATIERIDAALDMRERTDALAHSVTQTILNAKAAIQLEEEQALLSARDAKHAELSARRAVLEQALSQREGAFVERLAVTPKMTVSALSANRSSFVVKTENFPAGTVVRAGGAQQYAIAPGTSSMSIPVSVFGHDGRGSREISISVNVAATGERVTPDANFYFTISGGQHMELGGRSYSGVVPSMTFVPPDPAQLALQNGVLSDQSELARVLVAEERLALGMLTPPSPDDADVQKTFVSMMQQRTTQDRNTAPSALTLLTREALPAGTQLTGSTDHVLSPDATLLARARANSVFIVSPETQQIISEISLGGHRASDISWSPDSNTLAIVASAQGGGSVQVFLCNLRTQEVQGFRVADADTGNGISVSDSGQVLIALQSGGVRMIGRGEEGSVVLPGSLAIPGAKDVALGVDGLADVFTSSERMRILVDATQGIAQGTRAESTANLATYSGTFDRFSYMNLNMVNNTGLGQAQMAEKTGEAIADKLYTYADTVRLAKGLAPDLVGDTDAETHAKVAAYAAAHGESYATSDARRMSVYRKVQEGIDMFNGIMKEHYVRAFWIVHDLLTATDKTDALQKQRDIDYGAAGGQILAPIWTPALPTMRAIFADVYNGCFDEIFNAAEGVNAIQEEFWAWRAEANVGATEKGNNEGSSEQRQISDRLVRKINSVIAASGGMNGGHVIVAGKTFTVAQLQQYSSAAPSSYAQTAIDWQTLATKPVEDMTPGEFVALLEREELLWRLESDDPEVQGILDVLQYDRRFTDALGGGLSEETLEMIVDQHVVAMIGQSVQPLTDGEYESIERLFGADMADLIRPLSNDREIFALTTKLQSKAGDFDQQSAITLIHSWSNEGIDLQEQGLPTNTKRWTEVGQMLTGLLNVLDTGGTPAEMASALQAVAVATDIPLWKIVSCAIQPGAERGTAFKQLFELGNYGHLFSSNTTDWNGIVSAVANKKEGPYNENDVIRIRLDYAVPQNGVTLTSMDVYANPSSPSAGITSIAVPVQYNGGFFVTIKAGDVLAGFGSSNLQVNLSLIAHFSDGSQDALSVETIDVKGPMSIIEWMSLNSDAGITLNTSSPTELAKKLIANFENLPENSRQLIVESLRFGPSSSPKAKLALETLLTKFIADTSTERHKMSWEDTNQTWIGTPYESIVEGQCKYWLQQTILGTEGIDVDIGNNPFKDHQNKNYYWEETTDVSIVAQGATEAEHGTLGTRLKELFLDGTLKSGHLVQYTMPTYAHTLLIGAINDKGAWVFDANYVADLTVGYHFRTWESFNSSEKFTIYQINE